MGLLYPWAKKEYVLWEMSLPQVVLYHSIGIDMKYPKPKSDNGQIDSYEEAKEILEDCHKKYGAV